MGSEHFLTPEAFEWLGSSLEAEKLRQGMARAAAGEGSFLVNGPWGSQPATVARHIHEGSTRKDGPFVVVSCSGLSDAQLALQLFSRTTGLGAAQGGTLFLDGIQRLPESIQDRLHRFLQEGKFEVEGEGEWMASNARLAGGSLPHLRSLVGTGRFRQELYFRWNGTSLELPALAQRPGDLVEIITDLWPRLCAHYGKTCDLPSPLVEKLARESYGGNALELRHRLEGLLLRAAPGTELNEESLVEWGGGSPNEGLNETLELLELKLVRAALEKHHYNQVKAAEELKITRGALQYKMKKYHLGDSHRDAA